MVTCLSEVAELVAGSALLLRDGEAGVVVLGGCVLGNGSSSSPGSTCASQWATRKAGLSLRQCVLVSDCCIGTGLCEGVESRAA